jgi:hypothetical protein
LAVVFAIIRDVIHAVWSAIAKPRELVLENIALKHQLEVVLRPARPRLRLKRSDRVPILGGLHHRYERRAA